MKNVKIFLINCVFIVLLSSCAKNVVINYTNSQTNTGHIVIQPTSVIHGSFTINDSLLVKKKKITKITIHNIPEGEYRLHLTAKSKKLNKGLDYDKHVQVKNNKTNTQLITVPPRSNGYWIIDGGKTIIITFFVYVISLALFGY